MKLTLQFSQVCVGPFLIFSMTFTNLQLPHIKPTKVLLSLDTRILSVIEG